MNAVRLQSSALLATVVTSLMFAGEASGQEQMTPAMQAEGQAIASVCRADFKLLCSGVVPGGGRILACLEAHAQSLSAPCAAAMSAAANLKTQAEQAGVLPK